jgi:hypothetical protein
VLTSRWQATAEGDGQTQGYHLSSLYSPVGWFSWSDAARIFEGAQQNPDLMKGFVNTVLGEPYSDSEGGDKIKGHPTRRQVIWSQCSDPLLGRDEVTRTNRGAEGITVTMKCALSEPLSLSFETALVYPLKRGVAIFAKACFGHPSPSKQKKLNATFTASRNFSTRSRRKNSR